MSDIKPPAAGTPEYTWWSAGASADTNARNEDLSADVLDARTCLEGLARMRRTTGQAATARLLTDVAYIHLAGLPFRNRLRAALKLIRP